MTLGPEVKALLDQLAALDSVPIERLAPAVARANYKTFAMLGVEPVEVGEVVDRAVPGPAGDIPVRVYRPTGGEATAPVLVWFHGGGFVIGDLDTADANARSLAEGARVAVVSVDYRLAPEHPYPAAAEDCYATLCWVADHGAELDVDVARVAVGGDSAGGNLAAVTALMARDRGGATVAFQLLVYPVTDAAMGTESYGENANGYVLTRATMEWFWRSYLGAGAGGSEPYASPLASDDLRGLPPGLIITAEYDPLRDEGEAYGTALSNAGVETTVTRYDGQVHGFFGKPETLYGAAASQAMAQATTALAKALRS